MIVAIEPHGLTWLFHSIEQFQSLMMALDFIIFTLTLRVFFLIHYTHRDIPQPLLSDSCVGYDTI